MAHPPHDRDGHPNEKREPQTSAGKNALTDAEARLRETDAASPADPVDQLSWFTWSWQGDCVQIEVDCVSMPKGSELIHVRRAILPEIQRFQALFGESKIECVHILLRPPKK